jgi:hypothetical protein
MWNSAIAINNYHSNPFGGCNIGGWFMALGLPHLPLSKRDDPLFVFGEWRTEPFEVEGGFLLGNLGKCGYNYYQHL